MGPEVCKTGEPPLSMREQCKDFHDRVMDQRARDAARLEVPMFVSEFGACFDSENCAMEIGLVADASDRNKAGWAYWQFKNYWDFTTTAGRGNEGFYNYDGTLQQIKVKALARTYLPFVQGALEQINFDKTTGDFKGEFVYDASIDAPTVLYFSSQFWYPQGFEHAILDAAGRPVAETSFVQNDFVDNYWYF